MKHLLAAIALMALSACSGFDRALECYERNPSPCGDRDDDATTEDSHDD